MATHRQPRMEEKNASSLIVVAGVKRSDHKHDIADRSNISYSMDVNPPWAWHVACFARAYYWESKHRDLHPPWKKKTPVALRATGQDRNVGIRPFNAPLHTNTRAPITLARCGWPTLNGRMPTLRCGRWSTSTGVFFFHPRPSNG